MTPKPLTQAQLRDYYRRSNKKFEQASESEKRVILARDVQKLLQATYLTPVSGSYGSIEPERGSDLDVTFCNTLEAGPQNVICRTCALASTLVALLIREECDQPLRRANNLINWGGAYGAMEMRRRLQVHFSDEQIDLIEFFYEGSPGGISWVRYLSPVYEEMQEQFYSAHSDNAERLFLIMDNIIQNKGTFVPETLLEGGR